MKDVRTRFAPSPTGYLHVGGARTAFYAYLLARHHGGQFILRVEDTDQERLVPGAIKHLIEELSWFGIDIDEGPSHDELKAVGESTEGVPSLGGPYGPYIQSLRLKRYKEVAEQLISLGAAYRCDCTPEMLEKERLEQMARKETPGYSGYCRDRNLPADKPHVVRLRMPGRASVVLQDAVKGRVSWESIPLRDPVLMKSDSFPTYHLAVVVDDHDMQISHVLRGDEWLSSAPIHVMLYQALGWDLPVFCHLPVIKGPNGKKLSKRDGSVHTSIFREEGYLPEALLNFTVLIGWSEGDGTEQEIYTRKELIEKFSIERINPASGIFDYSKLQWMNGIYIRNMPLESFIKTAKPFIDRANLKIDQSRFRQVAALVQERVKILKEIPDMVAFLVPGPIARNLDDMLGKGIDLVKAKSILESGVQKLRDLPEFSVHLVESVLRPLAEEFGLKAGPLFGVFRIAVTGKKVTPPLFESMVALGREEVLERIEATLKQM